jgi:hypothetical protein
MTFIRLEMERLFKNEVRHLRLFVQKDSSKVVTMAKYKQMDENEKLALYDLLQSEHSVKEISKT